MDHGPYGDGDGPDRTRHRGHGRYRAGRQSDGEKRNGEREVDGRTGGREDGKNHIKRDSMRTLLMLIALAQLLAPSRLKGQAAGGDEAAVRAVVDKYLHGLKFN